jgi:hypothetical protein
MGMVGLARDTWKDKKEDKAIGDKNNKKNGT